MMVATVLSSSYAAVLLLFVAGRLEVLGFQLPVTKHTANNNQRCNVISSASSVAINMANEKDTADSLFGPRVDDGEDDEGEKGSASHKS